MTYVGPDGEITKYLWSKVSGPKADLWVLSASTGKTYAAHLVKGVYVFRVTVTDNKGATAYDDMKVTVN